MSTLNTTETTASPVLTCKDKCQCDPRPPKSNLDGLPILNEQWAQVQALLMPPLGLQLPDETNEALDNLAIALDLNNVPCPTIEGVRAGWSAGTVFWMCLHWVCPDRSDQPRYMIDGGSVFQVRALN